MTNEAKKTNYVAPSLRKMGRVEALTAGTDKGSKTDAVFNTSNNFADVTFS